MISPKWMVIRIIVSQGQQYKVGTLDIKINKPDNTNETVHVYTTNELIHGVNRRRLP